MDLTAIIGTICVFGFVPVLVYLNHRHKERKALIESGQSAQMLEAKPKCSNKHNTLKYGLVSIGVAIGIFAGSIFSTYTGMATEAAYFSMIFLFGGIALLIFYIHSGKIKETENQESREQPNVE